MTLTRMQHGWTIGCRYSARVHQITTGYNWTTLAQNRCLHSLRHSCAHLLLKDTHLTKARLNTVPGATPIRFQE